MQKYQNNITSRTGDAVSGLQVTVSLAAGGLATIYSDNAGTPTDNPITTDANGYFEFYAADGRYNITASGGGYSDVLIADTVLIAAAASGSASIAQGAATTATAAKNDAVTASAAAVAAEAVTTAARDETIAARDVTTAATTVAETARDESEAAASAAGLSADAALIQAGVYVDEPTGRAAVADGVAFKVQGSGDVAAREYRRVNAVTVSTLIATYPSSAAVLANKRTAAKSGASLAASDAAGVISLNASTGAAPGAVYTVTSVSAAVRFAYTGGSAGNIYVNAVGFQSIEGVDRFEATALMESNTSSGWIGFSFGPAGATRRHIMYGSTGIVQSYLDTFATGTVYAAVSATRSFVAGNTVSISVDRNPDGSGTISIVNPTGVLSSFAIAAGGLPAGDVQFCTRGIASFLASEIHQTGTSELTNEAIQATAPMVAPTEEKIVRAAVSAAGLVVTVDLSLKTMGETVNTVSHAGLTTTLDATATGTVGSGAPDVINISASAARYTDQRQLSSAVVKRVSDGVTLVSGTDYTLYLTRGVLYGLGATTGIDVDLTYNYARERYDAIGYDPVTNALVVNKGTERDIDAAEYLPDYPAGTLPVARVKVVGTSVFEIVPGWQWVKGSLTQGYAQRDHLRARNAALMAPFQARMNRGLGAVVMGYGDSITQLNDSLFNARIRSDTLAPYYTEFGTLDQIGWGGRLVKRLQGLYAGAISYINSGISGTTTGNTGSNGSAAARLAAATALSPNLVLICFGMNELGATTTRANLAAIISAFKAAGALPVLLSVPWKRTTITSQVTDLWATTRQIQAAALDDDVPYVDLSLVSGEPHYRGNLGFAREDYGSCDVETHPGPFELKRYADEVVFQLGM